MKAKIEQEHAANVAALEASAEQTQVDAYTVRKLASEFVDYQSTKIATWQKTQSNLNLYALPHIGDMPAHSIRRKDVLAILDALTRKGTTVTANRVLAAVRAMFNWAIQR